MSATADPAALVRPAAGGRADPLTVQVLSKRFGERLVLHDVNLVLRAGETVSLVGASGCGKARCCASRPAWTGTTPGRCASPTRPADRHPGTSASCSRSRACSRG